MPSRARERSRFWMTAMPTSTRRCLIDILENESAYVLHASVAGFRPEKVDVTFDEGFPAFTYTGNSFNNANAFAATSADKPNFTSSIASDTAGENLFGRNVADQVQIRLQARTAEGVEQVKDGIGRLLRARHKIPTNEPDDFEIRNQHGRVCVAGVIKILLNSTPPASAIAAWTIASWNCKTRNAPSNWPTGS